MSSNKENLILLLLFVLTYLAGYIIGRMYSGDGVKISSNKLDSFFSKGNKVNNTKEETKISIDSSTVVIDLKTDDMEKKYDTMGDVSHVSDNISDSVNRLKNMKEGT